MLCFFGHTSADVELFFPGIKMPEKDLQKASAAALNRTAVSVRKILIDAICKEYNIKKGDVRSALKIRKAHYKDLEAEIHGTGPSGIPLYNFSPSPRSAPSTRRLKSGAYSPRGGISVIVKRGSRKKVEGAFVAQMRSGHIGVFWRKGRDTPRLPIQELFGPSPIKLAGQDRYVELLDDASETIMDRNFVHQAEFYLKKAGLL